VEGNGRGVRESSPRCALRLMVSLCNTLDPTLSASTIVVAPASVRYRVRPIVNESSEIACRCLNPFA
jgi:hypothetical protein